MFIDQIKHLTANLAGVIVKGARRIGKSYLAERLSFSFEDSELLDASRALRTQLSEPCEPTNLLDIELQAQIRQVKERGRTVLIVDNAEYLLLHTSVSAFQELSDLVLNGELRIVLIRNLLVREHDGLLRAREEMLGTRLPLLELGVLSSEARFALSEAVLGDHDLPEVSIQWLADWSGGIPGLIYDLKPGSVAGRTNVEDVPEFALDLAIRFAARFQLEDSTRTQVIAAASQGLLPPSLFLPDQIKQEVGFLRAIGMLAPDYVFGESPYCGRFWEMVAGLVDTSGSARQVPDITSTARLASVIADAGYGPSLAEDFACTESHLPAALSVLHRSRVRSHSLAEALILSLGRSGIKRALRSAGQRVVGSSDSDAMVRQLLTSAGISDYD